MEYHNRREPDDYNLVALAAYLETHGFHRTFLDEDALIVWLRREDPLAGGTT
jgi:hypothetical protein